jgi:hypothetical protein
MVCRMGWPHTGGAPVCNLGNFLRMLATPQPIKHWTLTRLKAKLLNSRRSRNLREPSISTDGISNTKNTITWQKLFPPWPMAGRTPSSTAWARYSTWSPRASRKLFACREFFSRQPLWQSRCRIIVRSKSPSIALLSKSPPALSGNRSKKFILDDRQSEDISLFRYLPQTTLVNIYIGKLRRKVDMVGNTALIRSVCGSGFMLHVGD